MVRSGAGLFLVQVNFITGAPSAPRTDQMSRLYRWIEHRMELVEEFATFGGTEAATFEQDLIGVALRHTIGVENLMWATDYPHPDSTWPRSQEILAEHFRDVSREEVELIAGGNASRIYRL